MVTMECNKEDATKVKNIAEEKMKTGDFVGALKFVTKAQRLFPNLENILHMKTICDVHISATRKIEGLNNWYGILQVQPYADADAIKKQYRKLALILHPDKNKCVGTEAAFELVGEAHKWLSDQIKRSQYDVRYRSHLMVANKYVNANSSRNWAPANNAAENIPSDKAFWTLCKHCGYCHKYLREYINTVMYCSACQKSYFACNMGRDGVPTSSSTAGRKEFQDRGIYNTSRQNPMTGTGSGSLVAKMDKNGNHENHQKVAGGGVSKKDEGCTTLTPQTARTNSDEVPKTNVSNTQHQVKEPHTSATKTLRSALKEDQTATETRKAVEGSSKSSEVDGSDVAGVKPYTYVYKKRKSSRKKPQILHAEEGNNGDFVIPPNKKTKSGCEFESNFDTEHMAADNKSPKLPDSGVSSASSHAYIGKGKKTVNSGNEDILLAKNKESEAYDGNREDVALSSKIGRLEIGYKSDENPSTLERPDQEFNVFEVERKTEIFAPNQVWSTIDSRDGMPRKYAQVKKVLNAEFKLRITYLEPVQDKNHTSILVACGKFKNGKTEEVEDRSLFSGLMHHLPYNSIVSIYPKKGEVWAIFRDWNENWNTDLEKHQLPYKYDFVEIVSDFHDVSGLGVAYIKKIIGSVSLFYWEAQNGNWQIQFSPDEMRRFSHKVPAVKMIGKDKECVPADSYKLDPAALPKDICQVDMETDRETLKGKADGLCPEAPKVKVKVNSVTETAPSPKKRRKSDDDNGVCSNLEEVKGDARKSRGFLSYQVDEPRFRQKVEDRKNELTLLKNQIESEKKKLFQLEREMEEVTGRKKKELELVHSKIKESGKQRAAVDEHLESLRKLLERQSLELVSKEMELSCVKVSLKQYNSNLKLKEKLVKSLNNRETVCNKMIDSRSEELRKIQKLIEQQTNELAVLYNQGDSIKQLIQELTEKLIAKGMKLERVGESSKRVELELKVKEKRVQALNNQITITSKQLDLKSKELGKIQRELELKKQLRQMSNVLIRCEKQPAAASTIDTSGQNAVENEPINDDALTDYEFSVLTRDEVSNVLRALSNPAKFILEQVQEHISKGLGLPDLVLEIFVLFFEELTKIQRSDDPKLQDKATQVATLWKGNISMEAPKSSLEVVAFLLFIVAYGLKKLINIEETVLLASSIAHCEQAPRIFYSLSLNSEL